MPRRAKTRVPKTKTFAGCWTCRRRKVKCDGARPKCQRCARDYQCEGYDIELFWVVDREGEPGPSHVRHRAMIVRDDGIPRSCDEDEVQEMLGRLDQACSQTENVQVGPFSTFSLTTEYSGAEWDDFGDEEPTLHESSPSTLDSSSAFGATTICLNDWRLTDLHSIHGSGDDLNSRNTFSGERILANDVGLIDRDNLPLSLYSQSNSLNFELSSALYSNKAMGFLMHNYITNIPDLLQPAHHPRNPYKSIYVPSALIGSSNLLLGMGNLTSELSFSNVAIFHALLSVSAFHLRGTSYTENQAMFEQLGRFHRAQALQNLRMALKNDSRSMNRHTAMAVMLSLVTSDLMEGGMTEFWIHLEGCNRLGRSTSVDSTLEFQHKQLQTVCLFMTTLAKSAEPDIETLPWPFDDDSDFEPSFALSSPFDQMDSSLEFIYGITATLASFIHLITKLSQHTRYYTSACLPFPPSLTATCNILAQQITTWSISQELLLSVNHATDPSTLALIRHHVLAFHSAILIFLHTRLSTSLSPVHPDILESYSRNTLSNLLQMEEIKNEHVGDVDWKARAPVVWPGFVAACEAAKEDQDTWREWWTGVQKYRIGSIATMWTVVQEVWMERERGQKGVALWVDVCRRRGQRILSGG